MVHGWGVNGEEVSVYYFKCDHCGDISTREEENRGEIKEEEEEEQKKHVPYRIRFSF
jgi:hypothetical protein